MYIYIWHDQSKINLRVCRLLQCISQVLLHLVVRKEHNTNVQTNLWESLCQLVFVDTSQHSVNKRQKEKNNNYIPGTHTDWSIAHFLHKVLFRWFCQSLFPTFLLFSNLFSPRTSISGSTTHAGIFFDLAKSRHSRGSFCLPLGFPNSVYIFLQFSRNLQRLIPTTESISTQGLQWQRQRCHQALRDQVFLIRSLQVYVSSSLHFI